MVNQDFAYKPSRYNSLASGISVRAENKDFTAWYPRGGYPVRKLTPRDTGEGAEVRKEQQSSNLQTYQSHGLSRGFAKQALEHIPGDMFTIFAIVDALTRLAGQVENAGDRTALDVQAASLLALPA